MKTAAATDWLHPKHPQNPKPNSEKHVFDVYMLVAMLTEHELKQCNELRLKYAKHPDAIKIQVAAQELFGTADAPGFREARRQADGALPFSDFVEGYRQVMGY